MNFSEFVFQQIQKYHTKPSDILTLIFGITAAFIAIAALILAISKKNILFIDISSIILILLLSAIIFIYLKIPKSNTRIQEIEHEIILNQNMIDAKSPPHKERILILIEATLTKKKPTDETLAKMSADEKFQELISMLKPKKPDSSPNKDALGNC